MKSIYSSIKWDIRICTIGCFIIYVYPLKLVPPPLWSIDAFSPGQRGAMQGPPILIRPEDYDVCCYGSDIYSCQSFISPSARYHSMYQEVRMTILELVFWSGFIMSRLPIFYYDKTIECHTTPASVAATKYSGCGSFPFFCKSFWDIMSWKAMHRRL
jgi:hypothetical protein